MCASERVLIDPAAQMILDLPSRVTADANKRVDRVLTGWIDRQN